MLIDTNVIIDYAANREPFFGVADKIFDLCAGEKFEGYVAAHSIPDAFFIMRKDKSDEERRDILIEVCNILGVVGVGRDELMTALRKPEFKDFEDCLQAECALACNADYIITRNVKDFAESSVRAITPEEFLELGKDKTE